MYRKTLLTICFTLFLCTSCLAQFYPTQYRPPNQQWEYLQTPHFKIIFAKGNDSTAYQTGRILEEQYSSAQDLVGGHLSDFPVILNSYNDLSNGFVTPLHFRSEIELPPIKGKALNPQTGNWLENVAPHELVHALQLSNLGDYNIPRLISLFSPDLARSFHGAIPAGVLEGIAVHHETESVAPDGGRGNYPYFTNQFDAIFDSDQRWSMGQHVHISTDTRPFNRHYIGGYEFSTWLQQEFGSQTTKEALDFYMDFPFLGYGVALRHVSGLWPGQLYNRFEEANEDSLSDKKIATEGKELSIPYKGKEIHRPKWLSDSTIVFHGSFYNARSGFYKYDLESQSSDRILPTNSVQDYRYDLSRDRSEMLFSYYEADDIYDNTQKMELVQYDFSSESSKQLTKNGRVYAPVYFGDELLALQTQSASSKLVSVQKEKNQQSNIQELLALDEHQIIAVAANPNNNQLAVVVNKRGLQALWISDHKNLKEELQGPPDIAFEDGSIFDPEWHPEGNNLLFSSDFSGTHQLYEYDLKADVVTQITAAPYNAFEGSYSPDGERIAFVKQQKNERIPVVLHRSDFLNKEIDPARWQSNTSKKDFMQRSVSSDSLAIQSQEWETGSYSTGVSWLKPRTVLPTYEEIGNSDVYHTGFSLHSNNLLANQAYSAELTFAENRAWYDIEYQNKTFYPGFNARIFSQPSYLEIINENEDIFSFLRQERSFSLSVPFQYRINQNVFNTSLFVEPEIRQSQLRFFDLRTDASSDFADISIANIFGQFTYRLQQNNRDLQPNSGAILHGEVEHYLSSESADFSDSQINFQQPTALNTALYGYLSPFRKWNQSLRLGLQGITQSSLIFDNQSIVSDGFSDRILPTSNNLVSFSTRYTIPLAYVDDGGFLFPLYFGNIYLVAFSDTVTDPTFSDWQRSSRSVFGIGLRSRFRLSNLSFDIGVGFGYEPTRNNTQFFIGDF